MINFNFIFQIISILNSYLRENNSNDGSEVQIIEFLNNSIDNQKNNIQKYFWTQIETNLQDLIKVNNKFYYESSELIDKEINDANKNFEILTKCSSLFKNYQNSLSEDIKEKIFSQFLKKFKEIIYSDSFQLKNVKHEKLAYIYLNGINQIIQTQFLRLFLETFGIEIQNNNEIDLFNDKIDNLILLICKDETESNSFLYGLVDLYLTFNTNNEKLDLYLLNNCCKNNLNIIDSLLNYYINQNTRSDIKIKISNWILNSEKLYLLVTNQYFKEINERFNIIIRFNTFLIENINLNPTKVNLFFDALVKSIINYSYCYLNEKNKSNLNQFLEFCSKLLFIQDIEQNDLWIILINFCKIAYRFNHKQSTINIIIDELTNKIMKNNKECNQLVIFNIKNITNEDLLDFSENETIIINFIEKYNLINPDLIDEFYSTVLFKSEYKNLILPSYRDLFYSLLLPNEKFNVNLLEKFYLSLNYIYKDYQYLILNSNNQIDQINISYLKLVKQINYSFKILNLYFKNKKYLTLFDQKESSLLSDSKWWFYMIMTAILIKKSEPNTLLKLNDDSVKIIKETKCEIKKLLFDTDFLKLFLNNQLTIDNELDLNNLSLFFYELVNDENIIETNFDLMYLINANAYNLIKSGDFKMKYYLYDIPFAKYSIIRNINQINEEPENYLNMFDQLIYKLKTDLIETNLTDFSNLENFNFKFNHLIKYSYLYLDYLRLSPFHTYNDDFIENKFSKYLSQIIDLFIKIKEKTSFLFFYDLKIITNDNIKTKWQKFVHLDNLNSFFRLFYTDYKHKQFCHYLNENQWDFILCYSATIYQFIKMEEQSAEIEIFKVNFFHFVNSLIKSMESRINVPEKIINDWLDFFSREIFNPSLSIFIKTADQYKNSIGLKSFQIQYIKYLSSIVSKIPFECILFNDLEPNYNVLDESEIYLPDKIKTIFNYIVPYLKHELKSIQLASYNILSKIMINICNEFKSDTELDINIFQSLPYVVKNILFELNNLFSDLKESINFEQNILIYDEFNAEEVSHDVNIKLMSYILINRLILDMFATDNLDFKVKLVNDLREINFNDYLMHCLFRIMPSNKFLCSNIIETSDNNEDDNNESISNLNVEIFACNLYKHALKCVPAMIRDWWNIQPKRISDIVDKYTTKYVSPILIEEEIIQINRSANLINNNNNNNNQIINDEESTIKIRGMFSSREIISIYKMKELNMELIIQLPINYPLGVVNVSSVRRLGVSENEWRNWLIQLSKT
jgi:hypothetical protein